MFLEFRAGKRHSKNERYLGINTSGYTFSTHCYWKEILPDYYELSVKDYNEMLEQLKRAEFKEVDEL